ncbi:MAG: lysophospholipid acyltransferase family protein [Myxococcaceae bacterium]
MARTDPVKSLVDRLELPFNEYGLDPYGISKKHLVFMFEVFAAMYRHYFRVECHGVEHVPPRGRAMLVGNHSGGIALDGAMVLTSMLLELEPPRLVQAMVEKFLNRFPVASLMANRTGQFTGLPEHAIRLLEDERILMVFPEGARGTAKLYKERYSLVDFGTGFMRLALKARSPIIPFGFLGGGAAIPTVFNLVGLARPLGLPYIPVTPWIVPAPLPVKLEIHYGAPMMFEGTGSEDDEVIAGYVAQVKGAIATLIDDARTSRHERKVAGAGR